MHKILFSTILFFSGFSVLFIQLILGKDLLPSFGGSPNTWIESLAFFQLFLSLGYFYSFISQRYLSKKLQVTTFTSILFVGFLYLIGTDFQTTKTNVFFTLLSVIAIPYFSITILSPLIQSWYGKTFKNSPYYLYIFSNIGTFSALISYPFIIENNFDIPFQLDLFKGFFGLLIIFYLMIVVYIFKSKDSEYEKTKLDENFTIKKSLWIILFALIPSALLGVTTTITTTDISPIPLLWVLPLGLYFLSFSVAFYEKLEIKKWFVYTIISSAFIVFSGVFDKKLSISFLYFIFLYVFLFLTSIYYHRKVYELRPDTNTLSLFYFVMSIGGFFGGLLTGIIAPLYFNDAHEILIVCFLAMVFIRFSDAKGLIDKISIPLFFAIGIFFCLISVNKYNIIYKERSFFGIYKVKELENKRFLTHGTTLHGTQIINDTTPLSYYSIKNAISQGINYKNEYSNVGIIGLGTGSISCLLKENTNIDYYEIDPLVLDIASNNAFFTFLSSCNTDTTNFVIGDARKELKRYSHNPYDILIVDAFSSDNIPSHLLTKESFELYFENLNENGILIFHISNRYIDLETPISNIANNLKIHSYSCKTSKNELEELGEPSKTMVLSKNKLSETTCYHETTSNTDKIWTDNYNSILKYLKIH